MAGTIQIKRSSNTATPTVLDFGELAWSSNSGTISIGREDGDTANLVAIGGIRTPGTLAANQALVANSTSYINEVKAANLHIGTLKSTAGGGAARMDKLEDVREVSKANNNILVYDKVQDLFLLEAPNADGGTF